MLQLLYTLLLGASAAATTEEDDETTTTTESTETEAETTEEDSSEDDASEEDDESSEEETDDSEDEDSDDEDTETDDSDNEDEESETEDESEDDSESEDDESDSDDETSEDETSEDESEDDEDEDTSDEIDEIVAQADTYEELLATLFDNDVLDTDDKFDAIAEWREDHTPFDQQPGHPHGHGPFGNDLDITQADLDLTSVIEKLTEISETTDNEDVAALADNLIATLSSVSEDDIDFEVIDDLLSEFTSDSPFGHPQHGPHHHIPMVAFKQADFDQDEDDSDLEDDETLVV